MRRIDLEEVARSLHTGADLERSLRWDEARIAYEGLVDRFRGLDTAEGRGVRAVAGLRLGNALMELRQWDRARSVIDDALSDAKASRDPRVIAQALLAAGVFAANRDDRERAEAFLLDALNRFHRSDDRAARQGRGWAFLNLATLFGKTGRLDLAFVTFTKAQDVLGAAEDWAGVAATWEAQAQLRRAIQDEDRWREDLAEAIVFYDREGMKEKADRLRALLGKKLV